MCSDSESEPECTCSLCAGQYSDSLPSTTPSFVPKSKTLTDMPDEVINLIIQELQDAEWIDNHHLPTDEQEEASELDDELEPGEAAYCEISRELLLEHRTLDRLIQFEELMSSGSRGNGKSSATVISGKSPSWPVQDAVFNLSLVCEQIRNVITRLGYGTHLRLSFGTRECESCINMPEEWRRRVGKVTLVFDDTFSVGNKPSSIHKFLGFFPEVHTLTIIWNIQWERHDTRWKSMICRAADEPSLDHITQLEVVFQSHGKGARSLSSNDWQFQYLLSRLDPPHLERLIISDAGTWTAGESVYEMEVCFEKYYGNLAALCGRWLSLRSISVHQVINFDEDQHHSGIYEHLWASQLREFLLSGISPRARNHLCISYVGLEGRRNSTLSKKLEPNTPQTFSTRFLDDLAPRFTSIPQSDGIPDFDLDVRVPTEWMDLDDVDGWESVVRIQYRDNQSDIPMDKARTQPVTPSGTFTFRLDKSGLRRVYRMFDMEPPDRDDSAEI